MKTLLPVCDLELTKAPNRRKLKTESKSFATLFEKRCLPPVLVNAAFLHFAFGLIPSRLTGLLDDAPVDLLLGVVDCHDRDNHGPSP
ncbi:hypothetical protein RESH_06235 [Rhodopirellula europaea SH398]|jgi:hypothetical protein|uniref:Uncharacterized protein n=1 Tax=Rhodopirellula europaea SH398 TaxID=1263868 RepID=M5RVG5_9BACT|nr:hypothetical protein RESH_06235 [Rhodopirellula europaea SH398]